MKVELLGAINYDKLAQYMEKRVAGIVSDNDTLVEYLENIAQNNLCTSDNIGLVDDLISYINDNAGDDVKDSYVDALNNLKDSFYQNREGVNNSIKEIKGLISETNKKLENIIGETIAKIKDLEVERRVAEVTAAGKLSRFPGKVFEMLENVENLSLEKNIKTAVNICSYGHDSITDHDYCLFAIEDVSVLIEQLVIAERFSSFTIKSRREVDFSKVGYYINDFHDKEGNVIPNNEAAKEEFNKYISTLFAKYSYFVENGIPVEDARFVLPYNYYSNMFMGIDAHVLRDMIIRFTKTRLSLIQEVKEFGDTLYEIAKKEVPYIIPEIDNAEVNLKDEVRDYISQYQKDDRYDVLDKVRLVSSSDNIDDTILVSAIMRKTQLDLNAAKVLYAESIKQNPHFKEELMTKIFAEDKSELAQIGFELQIPISYAMLTHYTRHRTHPIMFPDFAPHIDPYQFMVPPTIKQNPELLDKYVDIFTLNEIVFNKFKEDYHVREEDLVYFTLSGNMVNIVTHLDGRTVDHILALRECTRAQWETRNIARGIHDAIDTVPSASLFSSHVGPLCQTHGICKEKEPCGRLKALTRTKE